ncbi:MAG: tetratricopeptide repeat protein [Solidesulfovibrio sp.]
MSRRILVALITGALLLCATAAFAKKKAPKATDAISAEYAKGVQAVNERHWNDGIATLTKVIDNPATPKDMVPFALTNRGTAYANKKMTAEALADLTKAIELKPDYTAAYYDRARILAMQNKHAEAVADLTKAIDQSKAGTPAPVQAIYYKNRGLSYGAMTKLDEAKADFKKAKELDPKIKIPMHYKPMLQQ